jgi:hypothetical protein
MQLSAACPGQAQAAASNSGLKAVTNMYMLVCRTLTQIQIRIHRMKPTAASQQAAGRWGVPAVLHSRAGHAASAEAQSQPRKLFPAVT